MQLTISQMMNEIHSEPCDAVVRAVITNNNMNLFKGQHLGLSVFTKGIADESTSCCDTQHAFSHSLSLSPVKIDVTDPNESIELHIPTQQINTADEILEDLSIDATAPVLEFATDICSNVIPEHQSPHDTEVSSYAESKVVTSSAHFEQEKDESARLMDLLMDGIGQVAPSLDTTAIDTPFAHMSSLVCSDVRGISALDISSVVAAATAKAQAMAQAEEEEGSPYRNFHPSHNCSHLQVEDSPMHSPSNRDVYHSSRAPPAMLSSSKKPGLSRAPTTPTKSTFSPKNTFSQRQQGLHGQYKLQGHPSLPENIVGPLNSTSSMHSVLQYQSKGYPTGLHGLSQSLSMPWGSGQMPCSYGSQLRLPSRLSKSVANEELKMLSDEQPILPGAPTSSTGRRRSELSSGTQHVRRTSYSAMAARSESCGGSDVSLDVQSREWQPYSRPPLQQPGSYRFYPYPPPAVARRTSSMHIPTESNLDTMEAQTSSGATQETVNLHRRTERLKMEDTTQLAESHSAPSGMIDNIFAGQSDDEDMPDEGWMAAMKSHKRFQKDFQALYLVPRLVQDLEEDLAALMPTEKQAVSSKTATAIATTVHATSEPFRSWLPDQRCISFPSNTMSDTNHQVEHHMDVVMQSPCKKRHLQHIALEDCPMQEATQSQREFMSNAPRESAPLPSTGDAPKGDYDYQGCYRKHRSTMDSYEELDSLLSSISREDEVASSSIYRCP